MENLVTNSLKYKTEEKVKIFVTVRKEKAEPYSIWRMTGREFRKRRLGVFWKPSTGPIRQGAGRKMAAGLAWPS